MRYKNISEANVRLTEYKFLGPNAEIELSEEDEKSPEIRAMIKNLGWLVPVDEPKVTKSASKSIISHGLPEVKGSKVYIPTTYSEPHDKERLIAEAVRRAKRNWNPMDDAAPEGEPDFIAPPKVVNTAKHYGNAELAYDATTKPVSHMGGTPNDSAETKNVSEVDLIPHHPEDLVKYQSKPVNSSKVKTRKKK